METSAAGHVPNRLDTILDDGEFVLCRGRDRREPSDGSRPVLVLLPRSEHPRPQAVRTLEHEYSLRDAFDPAWAVRPLALTTCDGRPALLLENPGGEPLACRAGTPIDIGLSLRVGAGLATALRELHGRGFIHKDIKPANVITDWSTGRVWLRGFGATSRAPRERRLPEPPAFIAGTLAYMAPEQTGWMNRSIDARSDLYSFGVVLYELLTGSLPFTAGDPMAWVHCHMARRPVPPVERRSDVPGVVSAIVMKLLAKTAEHRYQTAAGVERDLRRCLTQWEAERRIDEFTPAEHDTPDRLLVPEKLYGRTREVDALLEAFDRVVTTGSPELVLVSGYAGIGKSSVVNELHKALVPPRALFASGKVDQYKRDIPYATLAQAFQSLVRRLLGKSEADLAPWRDALRQALGPNGRLIADLVPELTHIVGDQPPVPNLPPQDAQRRFQLVFRKFIGVFARPDHPLALFLDDLQWLDAETLNLLQDLLIQRDLSHVLLVGAYRNKEVTAGHPLMRMLNAIRNAGAKVLKITLAPLTAADVLRLTADALRCEPAGAASLGQLVHDKTGGNPFFVIQFLSSLAEEGLLVFDHDAARWDWDLERIKAKGYTDNVVDLMVARLTRLPSETQQALQRLACLGNRAEIPTLSIILAISEEQVHANLSPSVRQELVEPVANAYRFVHDRVQESAYTLIRPGQRVHEHLRIGRLLASHTPPEAIPEHVFEIVGQFNRGAALIASREEREQVAELNLIAGQRAKASGAHASALTYLATGSSLLSADTCERRDALAFALELHRAECEFVVGDVAAAEKRLMALSARAANLIDVAAITCLREELFTAIGRSDSAVEACLEFLRRTGVHWSPHPTSEVVQEEYERLWRQVGSRSIEAFVDLPSMTNADCRVAMDVLNAALPAALFSDANLFSLVCCHMVNLTLVHGHCDASCVAYVYLGWLIGPRFGKYRAGFEFGKLGLDLMEQRGLRRFEARVYQIFGHLVIPWTQPLNVGRRLVERSFEAANRSGDLTYATYSRPEIVHHSLAEGRPLADVQREAEAGLDFARQVRFGLVVDIMTAQRQLIRTLRGLTSALDSFNDAEFDERRFEQHLADDPQLSTAACQYWIYKLKARFFAGDYVAALVAASNAQRFLWTQPTFFQRADYHLYAALTLAALCEMPSEGERTEHQHALAAHHRQLQEWAENCPANLEDSAMLVGAEVARTEGRETDAMRLYQRSLDAARANGFVHNEALAYELAGRFYASRGFEEIANLYFGNARRAYLRWGADGKVRQLDTRYSHLSEGPPALDARTTIGAPVEQLELGTVLKVLQAVSGEIVLEKLVETVLHTAIEHAGAERGLLIEPRGDDFWITAEARTSDGTAPIVLREAAITCAELPETVVRYAARSHESVRLDDASTSMEFSNDGYIRRERARSVLCLPLLQRGRLMALLYLENNVAAGVFTPARMAVLNVLASQAAMSLEKTRLYRELQQREAKIQQARAALAHRQRVSMMGEVAASLAHEVKQPIAAARIDAKVCVGALADDRLDLQAAREAASRMAQEAAWAADIVTRTTALFRKEALRERVNISAVIREMAVLLQQEAGASSISIRMELADGIPDIMADRVQLQQVFMNLMLNAIDAMKDAGGELTITVKRSTDGELLIGVSDTGVGLPTDNPDQIFESFVTTKAHGTGMGLAITRSIVEVHGGRLWATANTGPGATFLFTLPNEVE